MTPLPSSPAAARNRDPILAVLRDHLEDGWSVLEIASGTGEHAVWCAGRLPLVTWQPTDADPDALATIAARQGEAGLANLLAPCRLDAAAPADWPNAPVQAVVAINMIHIAPWAATIGLMDGAGRVLREGGLLVLYGPFREPGVDLAPGNAAFDADLHARDPSWGLRDLDEVTQAAYLQGLRRKACVRMPANNLTVLFQKT